MGLWVGAPKSLSHPVIPVAVEMLENARILHCAMCIFSNKIILNRAILELYMTFSWYHNSHLFHFAPAQHQIFKDLMGNTCFFTIRFSALLQIGPGPSVIIALNKESGGEICFVSTLFGSFNQKISPNKNIMGMWLLCLYLMFTSIMVVRM